MVVKIFCGDDLSRSFGDRLMIGRWPVRTMARIWRFWVGGVRRDTV
jgi:hypothetical protein